MHSEENYKPKNHVVIPTNLAEKLVKKICRKIALRMAFKFEKLKVWRISLELSVEIHELTRQFPKDEMCVLTTQIKRAADSVTLNITEGSTLNSNSEFKRFLIYANRSALEVVGCLYVGKKRKLITDPDFKRLYAAYDNLVVMIQALIRTLVC